MSYQLFTTMASGFESLVKQELQDLGYEVETENGRVFFEGEQEDIAKTNLWLRVADRVKILIKEFKVTTFEKLYDEINEIDWAELIPVDGAFPVQGKSVRSKLHHEPSIQSITKKAIVNKLAEQYHRRGVLLENGATYPLDITITKDVARVSLDTTGSSLFKRGYRTEHGEAPLKENFVAGLLGLTKYDGSQLLVDPMTGSGTIPIEAAMKARNIAPGMKREFAFEQFDWFDDRILTDQLEKAEAAINRDIDLKIEAYDINQEMIEIAKLNAYDAGVLHDIQFKQRAVKDFKTDVEEGIIIANPPYGIRMKELQDARKLYQEMGQVFNPLTHWSKYILTSDLSFEKFYDQKATKRRKLYNGRLRTDLFQFWAKR